MLTALATLSTPAAAQAGTGPGDGGWSVGLAGTLGSRWQVEALDVGYARAVRAGPVSVAALTTRLGYFADEGAIIGGTRGFVFGLTLAGRTAMARLADLGADSTPTRLGVDLTLEATGYAAANSPLPLGSVWGALSPLVGLRYGNANSAQYALLLGPTVFLGQVTQVRTFIAVRFESALARGKRQP